MCVSACVLNGTHAGTKLTGMTNMRILFFVLKDREEEETKQTQKNTNITIRVTHVPQTHTHTHNHTRCAYKDVHIQKDRAI